MKKIVAVALALVVLLASISALAEESAGTLLLSQLSLSHVAGRTQTVNFGKVSLFIAMGSSDGTPTLQATFDNGDGQVVDAVVQVEGTDILLSMGGLTGVFTLDLNRFTDAPISAEAVALGLGGALSLGGLRLDGLLRTLTVQAEDGLRTLELPVSTQPLVEALEGLLSVSEGMEATRELDVEALRERVLSIEGEAILSFRYNESSGEFALSATQGDRALRLSGLMEVGNERMTFIDIGAEEERYDLLNLEPAILEQMKGELNLIGIKFMHFADGSGLDDMI